MKLPEYLGGHLNITHVDYTVFDYIKKRYNPNSFLDVGCGPGGMLDYASKHCSFVKGIDGDFTLKNENIFIHDFRNKISVAFDIDFGWTVEFLEHIEEEYLCNVMEVLSKCRYVVMTHALPGKYGHHHVNCQSEEYWIETFKKYGLTFNEKETLNIRKISSMRREFMRTTGKFFINS